MITEFFSASFSLSMLPARLAVRNTKATFQAIRDLPTMMKNAPFEMYQSREEAQVLMAQLMSRIDQQLGCDPANLSSQEREMIVGRELAMAEQHLGQSLINMLTACRVLTAKPSRVIEHGPADRID